MPAASRRAWPTGALLVLALFVGACSSEGGSPSGSAAETGDTTAATDAPTATDAPRDDDAPTGTDPAPDDQDDDTDDTGDADDADDAVAIEELAVYLVAVIESAGTAGLYDAFDGFGAAATPDEISAAQLRLSDAYRRQLERLEVLEPPDAAAEYHAALVDSVTSGIELFEEFAQLAPGDLAALQRLTARSLELSELELGLVEQRSALVLEVLETRDSPVAAYLIQTLELSSSFGGDMQDLLGRMNQASLTGDEQEAVRLLLEEFVLLQEQLIALQAIVPPPEAVEHHTRTVEANQALLDALEDIFTAASEDEALAASRRMSQAGLDAADLGPLTDELTVLALQSG